MKSAASQSIPAIKPNLQGILGIWIILALALCAFTPAQPPSQSAPQPAPLVYTLGSSLVSFNSQSIAVSMGKEPLEVRFEGSQPVTPLSGGEANDNTLSGSITYPELWQGITLVYDAPNQAGLRSTYLLQPHAEPCLKKRRIF
jgi:hypothetical protein